MCGFVFDPLPGIDVLDLGVYWERVKAGYPKKQLHPALFDGSFLQLGVPSLRAWFISEDEERLLQVQPDRFYMNWRARDGEYPRFSDTPERGGNCLKRFALDEFERFSNFASERAGGARVVLRRVELTKRDRLVRGRHWSDFADLCQLMKVARVFEDIKATDPGQLQLRLVESEDDYDTVVTVRMERDAVSIEARMAMEYREELSPGDLLDKANHRLNEVFFGLLNSVLLQRFQGERS